MRDTRHIEVSSLNLLSFTLEKTEAQKGQVIYPLSLVKGVVRLEPIS